ncbi:MAG: ATP-binding protein [Caldilineales bacterium]|nr:ATP-binding protein [Caldilineales bacterium]
MIPRLLQTHITEQVQAGGKIVLIYGARQVGKTTLVQSLLATLPYRSLTISADELRYADVLSSRDLRRLRGLVEGYELLFVDEAQRIPEIGVNLKLLVDNLPNLRIIVTGSSSLDLASKVQEPLTGRAWVHRLYPIALAELAQLHNPFELDDMIEERLIYGSYPEIFALTGDLQRRDYLQTLAASYLYKDVLEIGGIRHSQQLRNLVRLLAFQIGNEVSLTELGSQLQLSKETVATYIDRLEQSFVVFRLGGFSRNLRKEVTKQDKIYFWDVGVRNVAIDNLKPLAERNDVGALWENFVIAERLKRLHYRRELASLYFWRTYSGSEIDIVEEAGGRINAFECKWGRARTRSQETFLAAYPQATVEIINRESYRAYLVG